MTLSNKTFTDDELEKYSFIAFDLDDTIVASQVFHTRTYFRVLEMMGRTLSEMEMEHIRNNIHSGARIALQGIGIKDDIIEDVIKEKRSLFIEENTIKKLPVYPKTVTLIERIYNLNIPMGIITNSSDENTHAPLLNHDLSKYFSIIHTRNTNAILKPDVQKAKLFEEAITKMDELSRLPRSKNILYVGDSEVDEIFSTSAGWDFWNMRKGL